MKNLFLVIFFATISITYSQSFKTTHINSSFSKTCNKENHQFDFLNYAFTRVDLYSGKQIIAPSKIEQTGYNNDNTYYEARVPTYILEEDGVLEYEKHLHFAHKIVYDKRGGNILYVAEKNMDYKNSDWKFYYTELGVSRYCK